MHRCILICCIGPHDTTATFTSYITSVEHKTIGTAATPFNNVEDHNMPCTVCIPHWDQKQCPCDPSSALLPCRVEQWILWIPNDWIWPYWQTAQGHHLCGHECWGYPRDWKHHHPNVQLLTTGILWNVETALSTLQRPDGAATMCCVHQVVGCMWERTAHI